MEEAERKYRYVITVRYQVIYQSNDANEAYAALMLFEKSVAYAHDVIEFDAAGSIMTVYPLAAGIEPREVSHE